MVRVALFSAALALVLVPPVDAQGTGGRHEIRSGILGATRVVFVHAPPVCQPGGPSRCAVVYLTDGEAQ